jgi:fatty acid desaturase
LRNNVFLFDFENVELLSMLSEDAKLRDLSERIRDVTINERNGLLIITMGVFLFCLGLVLSALVSNSFVFFGALFSSVLGIFSALFGFFVVVHFARQYNSLQKELEHALLGLK